MTSALPPTPDLPLHCAKRRDGPRAEVLGEKRLPLIGSDLIHIKEAGRARSMLRGHRGTQRQCAAQLDAASRLSGQPSLGAKDQRANADGANPNGGDLRRLRR